MLFNSISFAVFLTIVFVLYWAIPHKFRSYFLLIANYYFYLCWNIKYILILIFTTVISYLAARLMEKENEKKNTTILVSGLILFIGILLFFKYFNFTSNSIASMLKLFAIEINPTTLNILMPLGISFYTFQVISYIVDVYKGETAAEHNFVYYAVFVSFFPTIGSGPIERAKNLLPQLKTARKFEYAQATYGLKLMAWGFFKKLIIADTLAQYASRIFANPQHFQGFALVIASVFFAIQIYCDFSGYSDIAIGVAKLLGINLTNNFKSPYFSQSIKEFWSRWHISLSTWFRDYIYIPLGGNRVGKIRHALNLLITFLVSGLWHGANWTFVFWGGIHGVAQIIESRTVPKDKLKSEGILKWLRILFVFVFCAFAWIFFTSNSISDSIYIISHMFSGIGSPVEYLRSGVVDVGANATELPFIFASILLLIIYDAVQLKRDVIETISSQKVILRWVVYVVFIIWILLNVSVTKSTEFIYFKF